MAFEDLIAAASSKYGVRAALIAAVIQHESGGDPNAVGDNGLAHGLMQMHPSAAQTVGADYSKLFDPATAIDAGTAYLAFCIKHCGGDEIWGVAAFNQGPTVIGRARAYVGAVMALIPQS